MHPKVDDFIQRTNQWQDEYLLLQKILLECGLTEELKWGNPCYTFKKSNMMMIAGFKGFIALSFLKGVLLQDTEKLLVAPGENSQSVRYLKFTSVQEITNQLDTIKTYIFESIEVEKAGIKVNKKKSSHLDLIDELKDKMNENQAFKEAFEALTPGRQRGYHLYFSSAKQSKTRIDRIEKYRQRILDGIGIHDCICGQSKRMPNCDGSHKYL